MVNTETPTQDDDERSFFDFDVALEYKTLQRIAFDMSKAFGFSVTKKGRCLKAKHIKSMRDFARQFPGFSPFESPAFHEFLFTSCQAVRAPSEEAGLGSGFEDQQRHSSPNAENSMHQPLASTPRSESSTNTQLIPPVPVAVKDTTEMQTNQPPPQQVDGHPSEPLRVGEVLKRKRPSYMPEEEEPFREQLKNSLLAFMALRQRNEHKN